MIFSRHNPSVGSKLPAINPYLRDPVVRKRMVFTSVASSSAIEGIRAPFRDGAGKVRTSVARRRGKVRSKRGRAAQS